MEEIRMTVQQVSDLFGKSRQTIYNWIDSGKLTVVNSAKGKIIVTTQLQLDAMLAFEKGLSSTENTIQINSNKINQEESMIQIKSIPFESNENVKSIQRESIDPLVNLIRELKNELVEKSELAGQTKLLTDNLLIKEKDAEFYKNEYFKLKYENELLQKFNEQSQKENQELKQQLDQERNKPFWKKKVL